MSLMVTCTIKLEQQNYEGGLDAGEIFTEFQHTSSTGSFGGMPVVFIENLIDSAAKGANRSAIARLKRLKTERPLPRKQNTDIKCVFTTSVRLATSTLVLNEHITIRTRNKSMQPQLYLQCEECKIYFPHHGNKRRRWCSAKCKMRAWRKNKME